MFVGCIILSGIEEEESVFHGEKSFGVLNPITVS